MEIKSGLGINQKKKMPPFNSKKRKLISPIPPPPPYPPPPSSEESSGADWSRDSSISHLRSISREPSDQKGNVVMGPYFDPTESDSDVETVVDYSEQRVTAYNKLARAYRSLIKAKQNMENKKLDEMGMSNERNFFNRFSEAWDMPYSDSAYEKRYKTSMENYVKGPYNEAKKAFYDISVADFEQLKSRKNRDMSDAMAGFYRKMDSIPYMSDVLNHHIIPAIGPIPLETRVFPPFQPSIYTRDRDLERDLDFSSYVLEEDRDKFRTPSLLS